MLATPAWTQQRLREALDRDPHRSYLEHIDFLEGEFLDMMRKGQWVVLPFEAVQHLSGLRLSSPGVVPQRDRRPRWICDCTWSDVNTDTLPIAPKEAMQFGHALDRIFRHIMCANPKKGAGICPKIRHCRWILSYRRQI